MRWRGGLVLMALLVAACSSPGLEVTVGVVGGAPPGSTGAVVRILEQRLTDMVGDAARVEATEQGLAITLPEGTDPTVVDLLIAQGSVSMRPVLDVMTEAPDVSGGTPDYEYVVDSLGLVYQVGPAFVGSAEFVGGRASSIEGLGPVAAWVVEPILSEIGSHAFVEATKTMAAYPMGSPRRQMTIVLDHSVLSAPQLAPDVDPAVGLDPEVVVFTVGEGPLMEERARALAAYLRFGPLPVRLETRSGPAD